MQKDNNTTPFGALNTVIKFVLTFLIALACIFTLSQTSFAPPNFQLLFDVSFGKAVKTAEPIKQFFPKPIPIQTEEQI